MNTVFYGIIATKGRESFMLTFQEHERNHYEYKSQYLRERGYLVAQYELDEGILKRVKYNSI